MFSDSDMTVKQQEAYRLARRRKLAHLQMRFILAGAWTSCINCEGWSSSRQLCNKYGVIPPAEVLVVGCESWIDTNDIPF